MNLKEMTRYVLDKMNIEEGDRRTESLIRSALNDAYVELAKLDCTVLEETYYPPLFKSLDLPDDFLNEIQLSHSTFGKLSETQYQIRGKNLLLSNDATRNGTLTLIYGEYPKLLTDDADEPVIRKEYHRALCHYALYELTEQEQYMELYMSAIASIPPFEPFLDEGTDEEFVRDVYSR